MTTWSRNPNAYYEYALACCQAARRAGLKNVLVTCGSIEERPLRELLPFVDAAHVDLKGFDEETYRKLNAGRLATILNTLKIYRSLGVWFEVINLVVPTYTDNLEAIRRMSGWMVEHLGSDTPLHFSRFHPQHKLTHLAPTPIETLLEARALARKTGLRYVYLGNVPGLPGVESTFCPGCGQVLVERDLFAIKALNLEKGRCKSCRMKIAGVWEA